MTNYRPNIAAILAFVVLATSCSPPPHGPVAVAQSPPLPGPVVVPPTPVVVPAPAPPTPDITPGVTIPAQTPIGKRLIATFCPPHNDDKCAVSWRWLEIGKDGWTRPATTLDALIDSDGRRAIIWAQAGNYRVEVVAACADGIESYSADFTVGEPKPPEPSKTLKELAGPDAAAISAVYASMVPLADQFGVNKVATQFAAAKLGPLAKNPAAVEVAKRLAALGAPDDPVDVPQLKALLAAVLAELDAPGPAPVPTPGKKRIVILREASEPTAALARLITELRAGTSAKYLADKGHALEILDDESTRAIAAKLKGEGVTLPALFILTGDAVEFKQMIPPDATGANVIETIRQHGG